MVTIDRKRLISEKQNKKASAKGARLSKEAMLLEDIFKFTKPSFYFQGSQHPFTKFFDPKKKSYCIAFKSTFKVLDTHLQNSSTLRKNRNPSFLIKITRASPGVEQ